MRASGSMEATPEHGRAHCRLPCSGTPTPAHPDTAGNGHPRGPTGAGGGLALIGPVLARLAAAASLSSLLTGCLAAPGDPTESSAAGVARPGDWTLPAETEAIGDTQYVEYESAGAWNGGAGCSGGLRDGTRAIGDWLQATFGGIDSVGGYSCRQNTGNTSQLSVHGTGRALDLMISTDGGAADNDLGDPIANWLVEHAELVGVQFIIWDRSDWGAYRDPPKLDDYGGPIPHVDHIHMEVSTDAAEMRTPWFADDDGDGVLGGVDDCPDVANAGQEDLDGDGVGDACQDIDGDGVLDVSDLCPESANPDQSDVDADGLGDACDDRDDRPVDVSPDGDPPGDGDGPGLEGDSDPDPDPGATGDSPDGDPGFGVDARTDAPGGLSAAGCAVSVSRPSGTPSMAITAVVLALAMRSRRRRSR